MQSGYWLSRSIEYIFIQHYNGLYLIEYWLELFPLRILLKIWLIFHVRPAQKMVLNFTVQLRKASVSCSPNSLTCRHQKVTGNIHSMWLSMWSKAWISCCLTWYKLLLLDFYPGQAEQRMSWKSEHHSSTPPLARLEDYVLREAVAQQHSSPGGYVLW